MDLESEIVLRFQGLSQEQVGFGLLHLFVVDTLGRNSAAANIFIDKSSNE